MNWAIGIDLGGTSIKAGLVDCGAGQVVHQLTKLTRDGEVGTAGEPAFVTAVQACVEELERRAGATNLKVGLSAPGLPSKEGRCIQWMPGRMSGIEELDWSAVLQRRVRVHNDAHAALLGEVWTGAGRGCQDVLMLTLGTGVGGAVFSGGRLLMGRMGRAGHLGHVSVDAFGECDACGMPGSLELAIGNLTVLQRTKGRFQTTHELVCAVLTGDEQAHEWWEESVRRLAVAIASLINVLDPERVIVGGGIATGAGAVLFDPLRRLVNEFEWRPDGSAVSIVPAEAGIWAGVLGAVWDGGLPSHTVHDGGD
jgi:glucokinase